MRSRLGALIGLLALAVPAADAVPADEPAAFPLEDVDGLLEAWEGKGASGVVYISRDGSTLYEKGFGSASCDAAEAVTPDHVFMIGSITKVLTGLLAYVLAERGVLDLSDPVGRYLPSLAAGVGGELGAVTLQQLIDHTGGLPDLIDSQGRPVPYRVEYDYEPVSRDELVARASRAKLEFEPGSQTRYSNLGYQLLAAIFEVASGRSYEELLRQHVYEPAGMDATDFTFADARAMVFADGCLPGGRRWGNPVDDGMWGAEGPSWNLKGAGGLLSTARSLARLFDGIGDSVYFESQPAGEAYRSARLRYSERRHQNVMGPAGSNGIFNAVAVWLDGDRTSFVLLTNRADHQAENGMLRELLQLFPVR